MCSRWPYLRAAVRGERRGQDRQRERQQQRQRRQRQRQRQWQQQRQRQRECAARLWKAVPRHWARETRARREGPMNRFSVVPASPAVVGFITHVLNASGPLKTHKFPSIWMRRNVMRKIAVRWIETDWSRAKIVLTVATAMP